MEIVDEIIKFLRGEKEEWDREEDVKVSFKDVQTKVLHKASSWITFQDGSGGIKIYEEGSIPYSHDLDLAGVGRDVILGGAALFVPVVGPWVSSKHCGHEKWQDNRYGSIHRICLEKYIYFCI